jgi:hypothetical protein
MTNVNRRAELVDAVDRPFAGETFGDLDAINRAIQESCRVFVEESRLLMSDVTDDQERLNITLRLWTGCVSAGKTIASATRSGANTAEVRATAFRGIDARAAGDRVFEAGVEAAPAWKALRGDEVSFDGVPADSPVRRYASP